MGPRGDVVEQAVVAELVQSALHVQLRWCGFYGHLALQLVRGQERPQRVVRAADRPLHLDHGVGQRHAGEHVGRPATGRRAVAQHGHVKISTVERHQERRPCDQLATLLEAGLAARVGCPEGVPLAALHHGAPSLAHNLG
eukprot:2975566-Prymnesium_polylepis.2